MKRKLFSTILAVIGCFIFAVGFTACGGATPNDDYEEFSVTEISLNKREILLAVNSTTTLVATITLKSCKDERVIKTDEFNLPYIKVIWKSDDESIASVVNGKVTALNEGVTVIRVNAGDKSAGCIVYTTYRYY